LRAAAVEHSDGVAHPGELTHEVGANEAGPSNDENPQDTRLRHE